MNPRLTDFAQVVRLNQNRRKFWRWSEVWLQTGLTPTEFKTRYQVLQDPVSDPLWPLTQSAKNYTSWALENIIPNYSNQDNWRLESSPIGVSANKVSRSLQPHWAYLLHNADWYWSQKQISDRVPWLAAIPGVQTAYLLSSSQMEVASEGSDIDLAIRCAPYTAWLVRFYVKTLFKITGRDVHPFHLETILYCLDLLRRATREQGFEPRWIQERINLIQNRIWQFKTRPGLKLDAGIFYSSESQLSSIYSREARQTAWLWNKLELPSELPKPTAGYNPTTYFLAPSVSKRFGLSFWHLVLWLGLPFCLPLALLQFFWIKVKNGDSPNFWVSLDGIGFIPRFYKEGYLITYLDKN